MKSFDSAPRRPRSRWPKPRKSLIVGRNTLKESTSMWPDLDSGEATRQPTMRQMQRRVSQRNRRLEGEEKRERWVMSYADFITLLFALFVVMYGVTYIDRERLLERLQVLEQSLPPPPAELPPIAFSHLELGELDLSRIDSPLLDELERSATIVEAVVEEEVNVETITTTPEPAVTDVAILDLSPDAELQPPITQSAGLRRDDPLRQLFERLEASLLPYIDEGQMQLRRTTLGVEVEIRNRILFDSGSAELFPEAIGPLISIAQVLQGLNNRVRVEGFTDDQPINTDLFPSNWELSSARAARVVHLLMNAGIEPERMAAVGYGEYQPVAPNDSEPNRALNRRVVLVVLDEQTLMEAQQ